jgi:hypothetical protein
MLNASFYAACAAALCLSIAQPATVAAKGPKKAAKSTKSAPKDDAAPRTPSQAVLQSFDTFCTEWMAKLAARESDNVKNIKWEKNGDSVAGTYIGYSQEHSCTLTDGTGHVPVGHIQYRETRYKKQGISETEAQGSAPQAIEIYEATELFSYAKGKWVY